MKEKFSGSTATRAPPRAACSSSRPAVARFSVTSGPEVICTAATITGVVEDSNRIPYLAQSCHTGQPTAASSCAVSNSGSPMTPE